MYVCVATYLLTGLGCVRVCVCVCVHVRVRSVVAFLWWPIVVCVSSYMYICTCVCRWRSVSRWCFSFDPVNLWTSPILYTGCSVFFLPTRASHMAILCGMVCGTSLLLQLCAVREPVFDQYDCMMCHSVVLVCVCVYVYRGSMGCYHIPFQFPVSTLTASPFPLFLFLFLTLLSLSLSLSLSASYQSHTGYQESKREGTWQNQ